MGTSASLSVQSKEIIQILQEFQNQDYQSLDNFYNLTTVNKMIDFTIISKCAQIIKYHPYSTKLFEDFALSYHQFIMSKEDLIILLQTAQSYFVKEQFLDQLQQKPTISFFMLVFYIYNQVGEKDVYKICQSLQKIGIDHQQEMENLSVIIDRFLAEIL